MRHLVLAALATLLGGCPCTEIGCRSGLRWTISLPGARTPSEIDALSIDVCRNGVCASGDLASGTATLPHASGPISIGAFADAGATRFVVGWSFDDAMDGDDFTATIRDARTVLLEASASNVRYASFRPNGAWCPPECWTAEVVADVPDAGP